MSDAEDQSLFEDEGAGYLVSVSDIMAGLLFVFIITLVAFVIQFQYASDATKEEREQLTQKVDILTNAREVRKALLNKIKDQLDEKGVKVEVDPDQGILRLTEEAIRFRPGKSILDEQPKNNITIISRVLNSLLPCYTEKSHPGMQCPPKTRGMLEAVFVEGHTDNVPIRGIGYTNWELSSQRAINTYKYMREVQPGLSKLMNSRNEPLFSVAGYADSRPQVIHEKPTREARNRRIDMRFIMTPPPKKVHEIIQEIHKRDVR